MGKEETYDLLAILDFNNVRKRMSVSVKLTSVRTLLKSNVLKKSLKPILSFLMKIYSKNHKLMLILLGQLQLRRFNTNTLCLQVIVRREGKTTLWCKGADSVIYERLAKSSQGLQELTTHHLNVSAWTTCLWTVRCGEMQ